LPFRARSLSISSSVRTGRFPVVGSCRTEGGGEWSGRMRGLAVAQMKQVHRGKTVLSLTKMRARLGQARALCTPDPSGRKY
jgi:hypothetical protein